MNISGKTVLVTGSTDGLGKLLAKELAKHGCNLIIHGRSQDKIDKTISEVREVNSEIDVSSVLCDLNKPETVSDAFGKIEELDILVNNAGVFAEGDTVDITADRIIELVNVNLLSLLLVTRQLLPTLQKSDYAQILNVSSIAGVELPCGYYHTIYSAVKYGVWAFSEALAKEFENTNLRVMGFYPGGMSTDLFKKAGSSYQPVEPWMFDPKESVEAMIFMLTRNEKVNLKRMDLINHLEK